MDNKEKYEQLAENEIFQSSSMGVIPSDSNFRFTTESIKESLSKATDFKLLSFDESTELGTDRKEYVAKIRYKKEEYYTILAVENTKDLHLEEYSLGNSVTEDESKEASSQAYFLSTSIDFTKNALESFHFQLKLMNAVVPRSSIVVDFMSYRLLSGKWLSLTAKSQIPPSPDYLYVIHGVYDDKKEKTEYWFHTHGLLRCGIVELELVGLNSGAQQMYDLINNVVKRFLSDPIAENTTFTTGFDGLNLNLRWLRHEEALKDFVPAMLGGLNERAEDGGAHLEPSGVLFAVEDGNMVSPEIYAHTLANNPIYYISNDETYRMSELAKERYHYFCEIYHEHKKKDESHSLFTSLLKRFKKKDEAPAEWTFLVKLGLVVDNAEEDLQKEHLWFDIIEADDNQIKGKLINQPYWIAALNEGDIKTYPFDMLTDWIIYDPEGNKYTPDSIYQLI